MKGQGALQDARNVPSSPGSGGDEQLCVMLYIYIRALHSIKSSNKINECLKKEIPVEMRKHFDICSPLPTSHSCAPTPGRPLSVLFLHIDQNTFKKHLKYWGAWVAQS